MTGTGLALRAPAGNERRFYGAWVGGDIGGGERRRCMPLQQMRRRCDKERLLEKRFLEEEAEEGEVSGAEEICATTLA